MTRTRGAAETVQRRIDAGQGDLKELRQRLLARRPG
jgi:hypothetical protein